jgi:hypothetical protein
MATVSCTRMADMTQSDMDLSLKHSLQSATRAHRAGKDKEYHLMGEDRNARDRYRDHPYYDDCVDP